MAKKPSQPVFDASRFKRIAGSSRNYVDLLTGKTVSRRQRDKIAESGGIRQKIGSIADIPRLQKEAEAFRHSIKPSRQSLFQRITARVNRLLSLDKSTRANKIVVQEYVDAKRAEGVKITKREARSLAEVKQLVKEFKGEAVKPSDHSDAAEAARERNKARKLAVIEALGISEDEFWKRYSKMNGSGIRNYTRRAIKSVGNKIRSRNKG